MNQDEMGGYVARMGGANSIFTVKPFKGNNQLGDIDADGKIFEKCNVKMGIGPNSELHNAEILCIGCVSNRILYRVGNCVVLGSTNLGKQGLLPKVHAPVANVPVSM
jgi:hypothetical protein